MKLGDAAVDARLLVYCDDPTHAAKQLGPVLTDPDPVIPEGVYVVAHLARFADGVNPWHAEGFKRIRDPLGGLQPIGGDGSPLPLYDEIARRDRRVDAIQRGYVRETGRWSLRCPRCGREVRVRPADFDRQVLRGYAGISLAALQFDKRR